MNEKEKTPEEDWQNIVDTFKLPNDIDDIVKKQMEKSKNNIEKLTIIASTMICLRSKATGNKEEEEEMVNALLEALNG